MSPNGIILIDKSAGCTSFNLVSLLRKATKIMKIGHAGTLDPFATGVMVMLVGKEYTRQSDRFLSKDKGYRGKLHLGITTDTFDPEGQVTHRSDRIPSEDEVKLALQSFQGEIVQIPPMYSAKKVNGKKLCDLARKGITIERQPVTVQVQIELIAYQYPILEVEVNCSKGTYIRTLAHDIGQVLNCGAHLSELRRIRSGEFHIDECIAQERFKDPDFDPVDHLRRL